MKMLSFVEFFIFCNFGHQFLYRFQFQMNDDLWWKVLWLKLDMLNGEISSPQPGSCVMIS